MVFDTFGNVKSNCKPLTLSEFKRSKEIFFVIPFERETSFNWTVFLELIVPVIFKVSDLLPELLVTTIFDE